MHFDVFCSNNFKNNIEFVKYIVISRFVCSQTVKYFRRQLMKIIEN